MSVRADIAELLRSGLRTHPILKSARFVATEAGVGTLARSTVLVRQRTIGHAPTMPNSHWRVGILLTVISKHSNADQAANDLDALVPALLTYLRPRFELGGDAELVAYNDRLAYDINLTAYAAK